MTFDRHAAAHDLLGSEVRFEVIAWLLKQRAKGRESFAYTDISRDLGDLSDVHHFLKQLVLHGMLERVKRNRGWRDYVLTTSPLWDGWDAMVTAFDDEQGRRSAADDPPIQTQAGPPQLRVVRPSGSRHGEPA